MAEQVTPSHREVPSTFGIFGRMLRGCISNMLVQILDQIDCQIDNSFVFSISVHLVRIVALTDRRNMISSCWWSLVVDLITAANAEHLVARA
jgi:hypothetical protein